MSIQEAGQQASLWISSFLLSTASTVMFYSGSIIAAADSADAWHEMAKQVPGMVIIAIFGTALIRYLGGKIDKNTEATNKLFTVITVLQATQVNCKYSEPQQIHTTRQQDAGE